MNLCVLSVHYGAAPMLYVCIIAAGGHGSVTYRALLPFLAGTAGRRTKPHNHGAVTKPQNHSAVRGNVGQITVTIDTTLVTYNATLN